MMKRFFLKHKYLILMIAISSVVYFKRLSFTVFAYNDYGFQFSEALKEFPNCYTWLTNSLGGINLILWRLAGQYSLLFGLLGNLGFDSNVVDRFCVMWPWIILSVVSSFYLVKKITKSNWGGMVGSAVFSFNTYFLAIDTAGHLLLSLASVWAVLSILFFIKTLEEKKIYLAIITGLSLFISASYDFRMTYIILWISLFYFIYFLLIIEQGLNYKKIIADFLFAAYPVIIFIALSIFWVLPSLKSGSFADNIVLSRSLFGNGFFDITRSITLFHPFWTAGKVEWFKIQEIPFYFWLVPIFAFFGFVLNKKNKNVIFFGLVSLLGVLLSKQVAAPFDNFYEWIYQYLPGFSAFREASKFYFLIALGYSVLIGAFVAWFWERPCQNKWQVFKKYSFSILAISIFLLNTAPIITGRAESMFVKRNVPTDYIIFKDFILKDKNFLRTFWTPSFSKWVIHTNEKPIVGNVGILTKNWKNFIPPDTSYNRLPTNERLMTNFFNRNAENLFDNSSIKYVIVPLQDIANDNDFFKYFGGEENSNIRDWYIEELDNISWLKKIEIGTEELAVYENEKYKPHIYSDTGLNYFQTNASEFGDFSKNQNLYLNSDIEKNNYLLDKLDDIIVPVEANQDRIAEMKLAIGNTEEAKEKKKLQGDLDLYANNLFFKDFMLKIPHQATYKIYIKQDSVLAKNQNIGIQIDDKVLQKNEQYSSKNEWIYFNQLEMIKGKHSIKLHIGNIQQDAINSGDIVFLAENLAAEIKTPQLEYKYINPSKYLVNVHGAKESFPLIFSESFHPGWKIYIQPELIGKGIGRFVSKENQGTIQNENLDNGKFYDILLRKPVLDNKHFKINGFANAWWVDIAELEQQKIINKKNNGTYDFSVIIEFEPQKYFYIGLFISALALLACLGYLLYTLSSWLHNIINKKQRSNHQIKKIKNIK